MGVIGKRGNVHFQVEEEGSQNAGSEVTDHYSFRRADFKITEGTPPPTPLISQVQGESVKYAATRTGEFSEIDPAKPNQARFGFSRLTFALQLVSLQGLNMSTASTLRCPLPPSQPLLLSPALTLPAGLH